MTKRPIVKALATPVRAQFSGFDHVSWRYHHTRLRLSKERMEKEAYGVVGGTHCTRKVFSAVGS